MKILYYHQYFKTREGIGGTRSYEFASRLVKSGHEVTVICARNNLANLSLGWINKNGYSTGIIDGIKVIQIDLFTSGKKNYLGRSMAYIRFAFRSTMFAFKEKYDILFATSTPLTVGIPGIIAKLFRPKVKFIFEVRDLWPELPRAMGVIKNRFVLFILSVLESMCYRSANGCIGLSPGMVEGIARRGIDRKNIALIPNSSDLGLFIPGKAEKSIFPGCTNMNFIAAYTGTHGLANGLGYVLDMADYLESVGENNIKIVLIGDGDQKSMLVEKAKDRELKNCIFLDPVPKNELVKLLQASDAG